MRICWRVPLDATCVLEEAVVKRARADERMQAGEFLARAARLRNALMSVFFDEESSRRKRSRSERN